MNCEEARRRIYEGAANEASGHAESCAACRETMQRTESLDDLLRRTVPPEPTAEYWDELKERVVAPRRPSLRRAWIPIAAAALLALAVWLAWPGAEEPAERPEADKPAQKDKEPDTAQKFPEVVLPDDPAYEDKISSEILKIGLAETDGARADVLMEAATHRVEEIAAAARKGDRKLVDPLVEAYRILVQDGVRPHLADDGIRDRIRLTALDHKQQITKAIADSPGEMWDPLISTSRIANELTQ